MLNTKETLKKLHNKFPLMSLDELFEILDCYVEENGLWTRGITWSSEPSPLTTANPSPYITTITCNDDINTLTTKCSDLASIKAELPSGDVTTTRLYN